MTYWGFGVLGSILVLAPVVLCSPGSTPAVLIGAAFCVYVVIVNVGIWRAANKYTGHILWAGLAKLAAMLSMLAGAVLLVGMVVAPVRLPAAAAPTPSSADQRQPTAASPKTFTYEEAYGLPKDQPGQPASPQRDSEIDELLKNAPPYQPKN